MDDIDDAPDGCVGGSAPHHDVLDLSLAWCSGAAAARDASVEDHGERRGGREGRRLGWKGRGWRWRLSLACRGEGADWGEERKLIVVKLWA
jgi:hypothetical protein